MELTKFAHACVALDKGDSHLLIDPGTLTPNTAELVANTEAILITHVHTDHFDEKVITEALDARPELKVYAPSVVIDKLKDRPGQTFAVAEGQHFKVGEFNVAVFGKQHARIHPDIPPYANVGYLIDSQVFHPGDSYFRPLVPVEVLLLPTSGPWTNVGEAVDYVRAVNPKLLVQIHEVLLSEAGQQSLVRILGPSMLNTVPLTIVPIGDSITL
ncbi:MAG: MBL fold metallo-hydrolase [Actinomycetota bacterium]